MSGVILTSASLINTLAATRCLGRHGIKVACGDQRSKQSDYLMPAAWSRCCSQSLTYPSYATDPAGFVESICRFANRNREYEVLMPVDAETYVIAQHRMAIQAAAPHLRIPLHEHAYLQMANDKRQVAELARKIGVPVPETRYPGSVDEAVRVAGEMRYPAVVKIPTAKGNLGMTYVHSREEMASVYKDTVSRYSLDAGSLPMIQEYVPGTDYGVACLFNRGQLRAKIAFKSIRDRPPTGGQMVVRVSVLQERMVEYLVALAVEMKWHGVIMADFRLDERDNTPKLFEINPRFWGSLYQAIAAGVDLPYLLYRMAMDGDVEPVMEYKVGVRTRYLWADLKGLPAHWRVSKNRLRLMKEFLDFRSTRYDDMSIRDPMPVAAMALNIPIRFLRSGRWTSRGESA